jgi:uncharacterized protein
MSSLGDRQKQLLLHVARRALTAAVKDNTALLDLPEETSFGEHAGAFVTLHYRKRLRGCIGQLNSQDPLAKIVAEAAKSAALDDPRFKPVQANELADIDIELSVLSAPQEVEPDQIEAGRHGLIVSRGWHRGVLLPQVATERRWNAQRFLEETCVKAGLEPDAWRDPDTRVQAFTAEVFGEPDFQNSPPAATGGRSNYSIST